MSAMLPRQKISVQEYERMIEAGELTEYDRVELLRGEIVDKMTIGDHHASSVARIVRLFTLKCGERAFVYPQNPLVLDDSEPEPDVQLLVWKDDLYRSGKPRGNDVLLLIEVADTTFDLDRDVKAPLYAESGIRECWLLDLNDEQLHVFRQPNLGVYADERTLTAQEWIRPLAFPDLEISVRDLL